MYDFDLALPSLTYSHTHHLFRTACQVKLHKILLKREAAEIKLLSKIDPALLEEELLARKADSARRKAVGEPHGDNRGDFDGVGRGGRGRKASDGAGESTSAAGGGGGGGGSDGDSPPLSLDLFERLDRRRDIDTDILLRRLSASAADRRGSISSRGGRRSVTRRWSLASAFGSFRSRRSIDATTSPTHANDGAAAGKCLHGDASEDRRGETAVLIATPAPACDRPSKSEREASIEACVDIPAWVRSTTGDMIHPVPPRVESPAVAMAALSSGGTRVVTSRVRGSSDAAPLSPARVPASGPIATSSAERPRTRRHRPPPRRAESALASHHRADSKYAVKFTASESKYSVEYALERAPGPEAWVAPRPLAPPVPASILKSKLYEPEKVLVPIQAVYTVNSSPCLAPRLVRY